MNISYAWLKDFVDVREAPQKLADRLTMAGLEVKSVKSAGSDSVFEIEITSNRPDWLSILGVAREVSALTGGRLKLPAIPARPAPARGGMAVTVNDRIDCPFYTATLISGVKIGPSPDWLKKRLEAVGSRSINNVVDATNYVMFEMGTPVHAFDRAALTGGIVVRRATAQEKLITIDGEERSLHPGVLVIADEKRPVALAGVIGGKETEVSESSRDIVLEVAVFNQLVVRRGRQSLGIQTEASYRFERGVDCVSAEKASRYCAEMITRLCGGTIRTRTVAGSPALARKTCTLRKERIEKVLDIPVSLAYSKTILSRLGFSPVTGSKGTLKVGVPSFRQDISGEADLVEEVARIYGFERIPSRLPALNRTVAAKAQSHETISAVKRLLAGCGLYEIKTYSLIDRAIVSEFKINEEDLLSIANPLSIEQEILQPSLMPGVARCIAHNFRQKQEWGAVFEVAHVFGKKEGERNSLCIGLAGSTRIWAGPDKERCEERADFLRLKGILETLCFKLAIPGDMEMEWVDSGCEAAISIGGRRVGRALRLSDQAMQRLEVKDIEICLAELDLDAVIALIAPCRTFTPLPRFPSLTRDVTLELPENVPLKDVIAVFMDGAKPLISGALFVDYYAGKQVPPGYKRLTLSCRYSSGQRTLTEEEIIPLHQKALDMAGQRFGARVP